jgi:anion-transporting  ArsA/GET3 family ATPase
MPGAVTVVSTGSTDGPTDGVGVVSTGSADGWSETAPLRLPSVSSHDFGQVRLHIVTGKGGTGKSTVAAALALGLAATGTNVLLCEVEGRQGIARMFDVEPLPYAERRIATGLPGPDGQRGGIVHALHMDPEAALLEYLSMYYKLGRAGKALDRLGVVEFATTIAPGVRDVLLTGKLYETTKRNARNKNAVTYDAVVLDAPPTGRIAQFLGVNHEVAGLARMGPIKTQADSVIALFGSERTAVHLVTVLEEMPVQETTDGIAELRRHGLRVGGVVVNQVRPRDLDEDDLAAVRAGKVTKRAVSADLNRAGLPGTGDLVLSLLGEARDHAERRALEEAQRTLVGELGVPTYELPLLVGGIDLGGLYELAGLLRDQGLA